MTVSYVCRQWVLFPPVRTWRIEEPFIQGRPGAETSTSTLLLASCLAEGRGAHQGLAGIRPAIRVGVPGVVVVQPAFQALLEVQGRGKVTAPQEPSGQNAEERFHLVQPRAVQ